MYFVKYGSELLHDPRVEGVLLSSLSLEANENESAVLTFQIDKTHPMLDKLEQRNTKKLIEVYDDKLSLDDPYFQGFIYEINTDFYLTAEVKCKSVLSFLNDSILRPYSTLATESRNVAPTNPFLYFRWLLENHNDSVEPDKRFVEGINQANMLDTNDYIYRSSTKYTTVGDEIKTKLIGELGGCIRVRIEGGVRYLDYIADFEKANTQVLDFGVNLTDFTRTDDAEEIVTAVVPLGANMEETPYSYNKGYVRTSDTSRVKDKSYYTYDAGKKSYSSSSDDPLESGVVYYEHIEADDESKKPLTVQSISDGSVNGDIIKVGDYIYSTSAAQRYGLVFGIYENSDITLTENLLSSAVKALNKNLEPNVTIEVKAVDLSLISDKYKPIQIGEYVRVRSDPHNFDSFMLCTDVSLNLVNPSNSVYVLGFTRDTLTNLQSSRIAALNATVNHVYQAADAISQEAKDAAQMATDASGKATEAASGVADLEQKFATLKGKFLYIRYSAHADGSDMTSSPADDTEYMGIYSGDAETAPESASEYVWSLIRGNDGVGVKGDDGAPAYLHIKYSDDGATFTANGGETAGEWMGTYSDNIKDDSATFSDYTWSRIKGDRGEQGLRGLQGERGEQGIAGATGSDGKTSYFHVKYSPVASPTAAQMTETPDVYIGTYVDTTEADSTSPSSYTWARFQGLQGEQGEQGIAGVGVDGKTSYLHIKYSDNGTSFTANGGETVGAFIGTCVDFNSADPTTFSAYTWAKIKGEQGEQGLQGLRGLQGERGEQGLRGETGASGESTYFHIAYATNSSGTAGFSVSDAEGKTYIGTYVDGTETDSTDPSRYAWQLVKGAQGERGEQGIPGVGADGKTTYLHIKYSDDNGRTFTANGGEDAGDYIGTCTDFNVNDPTSVGAYKWARIKGDKGSVTFTDTPTTPYFVGDMWTVQASGDQLGEDDLPFELENRAAIYVCIKDSGSTFQMSDWSVAGTDDAAAKEAADSAASALDTANTALQRALQSSNVVKIETLYSADGGATWTTEQPTGGV